MNNWSTILIADMGRDTERETNILQAMREEIESRPRKRLFYEGTLLSSRKGQVVAQIALGKSSQEIASELGISFNTVKVHVSQIFNLFEDLGYGRFNRVGLTVFLMEIGEFVWRVDEEVIEVGTSVK